jgi:hypothetical protein
VVAEAGGRAGGGGATASSGGELMGAVMVRPLIELGFLGSGQCRWEKSDELLRGIELICWRQRLA